MTPTPPSALDLEAQALDAYEAGRLVESADLYAAALEAFQQQGDEVKRAEVANSLSVVLLQAGRNTEALEAVQDTPSLFLSMDDDHRAAHALGNLGAALEACGHVEGALEAYKQALEHFSRTSDQEAYKFTLQALSRLQLREGNPLEALNTMQSGLESSPRKGFRDRLLQRLLRLPSQILRR